MFRVLFRRLFCRLNCAVLLANASKELFFQARRRRNRSHRKRKVLSNGRIMFHLGCADWAAAAQPQFYRLGLFGRQRAKRIERGGVGAFLEFVGARFDFLIHCVGPPVAANPPSRERNAQLICGRPNSSFDGSERDAELGRNFNMGEAQKISKLDGLALFTG